MLNIIITAGGTSEKIDSVRKITNNSSGKLGSIIADTFLNKNYNNIEKIYYICPKNAIKPQFLDNSDKIELKIIESTDDVYTSLQTLLQEKNIDIVVHSMAISDYTLDYVSTCETFAKCLENKNIEEIENILNSSLPAIDNQNKISSDKSDLIIKLKPTKKIISYIKKWSPKTTLVGFKLLACVSESQLISVANKLLAKNDCDYVVANDIKNIDKNSHQAFIIDKHNQITKLETKQEIADMLCQKLFN